MQVFDEITKSWKNSRSCFKIVLQHLPNQIIFGYVSNDKDNVRILLKNSAGVIDYYITNLNLFKGDILYSNKKGVYFSPIGFTDSDILLEQLIKGNGNFPYLLTREYEAIESFDIFKDKQTLLAEETSHPLSNYLKYTFGLEFETSQGYIPENICYRDGLIPLRDGSISGVEYSTIILKGNEGISLLHQQLETLNKYTNFNKECSLHVHLGGFPLEPKTIFNLYYVCKSIESSLEHILPAYTFTSSIYKDNGKDYCKKLPSFGSFNEMYRYFVGRNFYGSFMQAHPQDKERKRKWNVQNRYFWCNFINALCYKVNKTIEFRFLRPTYNFKKILLWLYIFNGILKYSEEYYMPSQLISLEEIINKVYPSKLAKELNMGIDRLWALSINQQNNGDNIGSDTSMEDSLFNDLKI